MNQIPPAAVVPKKSDWWLVFKKFLKHGTSIATFAPSSKFLARSTSSIAWGRNTTFKMVSPMLMTSPANNPPAITRPTLILLIPTYLANAKDYTWRIGLTIDWCMAHPIT